MIGQIPIPNLPPAPYASAGDYTLLSVTSAGAATRKISISALFTVNAPGYAASGSNAAQFTGSANSYYQISVQNALTGNQSSSDVVVTADLGNDNAHFADFGINSSVGASLPFGNPYAAYLFTSDGELNIGALGYAGTINFWTGGGLGAPVGGRVAHPPGG